LFISAGTGEKGRMEHSGLPESPEIFQSYHSNNNFSRNSISSFSRNNKYSSFHSKACPTTGGLRFAKLSDKPEQVNYPVCASLNEKGASFFSSLRSQVYDRCQLKPVQKAKPG